MASDILSDPLWGSSCDNKYLQELTSQARKNWQDYQTLSPASDILTKELLTRIANRDISSSDKEVDDIKNVVSLLKSCSSSKDCGVLGCRKCGLKINYEQAVNDGYRIANSNSTTGGYVVAITIKRVSWEGDLKTGYETLQSDLDKLELDLKESKLIKDFQLYLDCSTETVGLENRIIYKLHIHGVAVVSSKQPAKTMKDCITISLRNSSATHIWCELVGNKQPNKHLKHLAPLKEIIPWCLYCSKLASLGHNKKSFNIDAKVELISVLGNKSLTWGYRLKESSEAADKLKMERLSQQLQAIASYSQKVGLDIGISIQSDMACYNPCLDSMLEETVELCLRAIIERSSHDPRQLQRRLVEYAETLSNKPHIVIPRTVAAIIVFSRIVERRKTLESSSRDSSKKRYATRALNDLNQLETYWPSLLSDEEPDNLQWDKYYKIVKHYISRCLRSN